MTSTQAVANQVFFWKKIVEKEKTETNKKIMAKLNDFSSYFCIRSELKCTPFWKAFYLTVRHSLWGARHHTWVDGFCHSSPSNLFMMDGKPLTIPFYEIWMSSGERKSSLELNRKKHLKCLFPRLSFLVRKFEHLDWNRLVLLCLVFVFVENRPEKLWHEKQQHTTKTLK